MVELEFSLQWRHIGQVEWRDGDEFVLDDVITWYIIQLHCVLARNLNLSSQCRRPETMRCSWLNLTQVKRYYRMYQKIRLKLCKIIEMIIPGSLLTTFKVRSIFWGTRIVPNRQIKTSLSKSMIHFLLTRFHTASLLFQIVTTFEFFFQFSFTTGGLLYSQVWYSRGFDLKTANNEGKLPF